MKQVMLLFITATATYFKWFGAFIQCIYFRLMLTDLIHHMINFTPPDTTEPEINVTKSTIQSTIFVPFKLPLPPH